MEIQPKSPRGSLSALTWKTIISAGCPCLCSLSHDSKASGFGENYIARELYSDYSKRHDQQGFIFSFLVANNTPWCD